MKPAYEEAATQMIEESVEGKLAAVDATDSKDLGERFGVKGYPSVKYFQLVFYPPRIPQMMFVMSINAYPIVGLWCLDDSYTSDAFSICIVSLLYFWRVSGVSDSDYTQVKCCDADTSVCFVVQI